MSPQAAEAPAAPSKLAGGVDAASISGDSRASSPRSPAAAACAAAAASRLAAAACCSKRASSWRTRACMGCHRPAQCNRPTDDHSSVEACAGGKPSRLRVAHAAHNAPAGAASLSPAALAPPAAACSVPPAPGFLVRPVPPGHQPTPRTGAGLPPQQGRGCRLRASLLLLLSGQSPWRPCHRAAAPRRCPALPPAAAAGQRPVPAAAPGPCLPRMPLCLCLCPRPVLRHCDGGGNPAPASSCGGLPLCSLWGDARTAWVHVV
jgi:hypothetical protein